MNSFVPTDHASTRMAQRSVSVSDIELITLIGTEVSDGYLVRTQDCQQIEMHLKRLLDRIRRLPGMRLVVIEGRMVTVYRASQRRNAQLLRKAQERDLCE